MKEEISLLEIFMVLKRRAFQITIWSCAGLLVAVLYTFFLVTPMYQSTSKIVVNQTENTDQVLTNTDIQTNLNLINTYQSIIKEPIILEEVIAQSGSDLTVAELGGKITVQTEANSLVFGIAVIDTNPYVAADLANATANLFQQKIGEILEVKSVTILSSAAPELNPVSPNIPLNLILGAFLGMLIGSVTAIIAEMTNKTVKDEKFIESLGWTNLGSVLEMTADEIKSTRISAAKTTIRQNGKKLSRRRV